ncbi:MAG: alpha-N-arabinofuranosidase [Bacteroides sp. SM23_62_1]|nr:MAG: alpha-N-arabinofuranosidase [Bacteroides sp. SM23_62_1]
MKKIIITLGFLCATSFVAFSQEPGKNKLIINADQGQIVISKHIYGHFSEHLGQCIYGGIWVGEDSNIPNTDGIRNDVIEALRKIQIPNLRWPGGCFADEYHWKDGIGPRESRPKIINTHWGGVVEDNSFGTHEFLHFCELIGAEPYLSLNLGSGTVEEMSQWIEYVNSDGDSPMANLRRENGHEAPWNVKYVGIGNEPWGCGGNMRPEYYSDLYRQYATYCRNYGSNRLYKIAAGSSGSDVNWTKVLMENIGNRMHGLSLHHYTVKGWSGSKGSATEFTTEEYFATLQRCLRIESILQHHTSIMDHYDPGKRIGLMVDEWGTWYDVEPGTNPGFLYQQNTLRDAFVAGITLNTFNKYADRVKMANIAQLVNVLQALILTDEEKMILTPTYHVFDLYKVHQEAVYLPSVLETENYELNGEQLPVLNVSVSKSGDGTIHISIVNIHPDRAIDLQCELRGVTTSDVKGKILTAPALNTHNTFDAPDNVRIAEFTKMRLKDNILELTIPSKSIIVLAVR